MKAPPFKHHAPRTLGEALGLMAALDNARALAGGQSLMPMLNLRVAAPDHLVDLNGVDSLRGVSEDDTHVHIGAMTRQRELEKSALIARACPLLAQAIHHVGHQQTRNRGTIGGSLCHSDPGAELPVAAMALDAELLVAGARGERALAFRDFPSGYLQVALEPDELLTRVSFRKAAAREGTAFLEFNLRPADFAVVSVAARLALDNAGKIADAAIAIGGVQATPLRLRDAEQAMRGHAPSRELFEEAARAAAAIDCDGDSVHPPEFRGELCGALTRRALAQAAQRAEARDV
jgi:carbon-monoxide dehydrogenase medium subunit